MPVTRPRPRQERGCIHNREAKQHNRICGLWVGGGGSMSYHSPWLQAQALNSRNLILYAINTKPTPSDPGWLRGPPSQMPSSLPVRTSFIGHLLEYMVCPCKESCPVTTSTNLRRLGTTYICTRVCLHEHTCKIYLTIHYIFEYIHTPM